eukprot:CAMPEP_0196574566 /NCGR_PEP_ID=MMETSP1081-20130531/4267_1 /TAXON_ID=36882 /ORGANISM="Pyramimonas amylifera, Strain CCMP720" /LENGTH=206 /DNA_ID=CAMNT_0041892641 /DNA_START=149 /DNA_END=769 /DNA_ORIENTATION=+
MFTCDKISPILKCTSENVHVKSEINTNDLKPGVRTTLKRLESEEEEAKEVCREGEASGKNLKLLRSEEATKILVSLKDDPEVKKQVERNPEMQRLLERIRTVPAPDRPPPHPTEMIRRRVVPNPNPVVVEASADEVERSERTRGGGGGGMLFVVDGDFDNPMSQVEITLWIVAALAGGVGIFLILKNPAIQALSAVIIRIIGRVLK